jgi:hypothetical protein
MELTNLFFFEIYMGLLLFVALVFAKPKKR